MDTLIYIHMKNTHLSSKTSTQKKKKKNPWNCTGKTLDAWFKPFPVCSSRPVGNFSEEGIIYAHRRTRHISKYSLWCSVQNENYYPRAVHSWRGWSQEQWNKMCDHCCTEHTLILTLAQSSYHSKIKVSWTAQKTCYWSIPYSTRLSVIWTNFTELSPPHVRNPLETTCISVTAACKIIGI